MITKLKKLFIKEPKLPENDLIKITSRERINGLDIFHGICKKKVTQKDIKPLTDVTEKMYNADAYITIDPDIPNKLKIVLKPKK